MPSTVKYTEVDLSKLTFSTPIENAETPDITKYQLMSLPSYNDEGLLFVQGPWMKLDYYGFPSKFDKAGKPNLNNSGKPMSDRERGKVKIPFNHDNPESKKLYDVLTSIDDKCEAEKETLFGDKKKAAAYNYQPMVREAAEDPDAPEGTPPKPDYFVVKLDFKYGTPNVSTELYVNDGTTRTKVEAMMLDDIQKHLRYKCEFRPIFSLSKLFSTRAAKDGKRTYGIGLKLKMVEVRPFVMSAKKTEPFFIDSDDEEEERKELVSAKASSSVASNSAAAVRTETAAAIATVVSEVSSPSTYASVTASGGAGGSAGLEPGETLVGKKGKKVKGV